MSTATIAGLASADIYCHTSNTFCVPNQQSTYFWLHTGYQGNDNGVSFIRIYGDDMNDVVGSITIGDPNWQHVDVPDISVNVSDSGERTDIKELWQITGSSASKMWISLIAINGDLGYPSTGGPIKGLRIRNVDVGGNCYADILANGTELDAGAYASLQVDGDWVSGSYSNNTAPSIWKIKVEGYAGSISKPVEIWAKNQITLLDIGGNFIGQVGENDDGYAGHPDVAVMEIGGDFIGSGSMTMNSLGALIIGGDFDANVTLSSVMASSVTLYDIGGEFSASSSFTLPADGLVGQVIINSGDNSNVWNGDIIVGTATLTANYTELSSSLGGGQIGEAPFNFHQRTSGPGSESRDCVPYHTEVLIAAYDAGAKKNETIDEVRIRHYGPVYADGTNKHYVIEFKSDVLPSSWVDRSGLFKVKTASTVSDPDDCNEDFPCTATTAATAHRDAVIMKDSAFNPNGFTASGWWRIRPNDAVGEGRIKCGDVDGNPEVEYVTSAMVDGYYWYNFRVRLEAPSGSLLMTDGTSASDLTSWIASPFEVNADGETDTQDFTELVEDYTSN